MTLNLLNVLYVLVALAMTALILLQRGAGAQAGSGFGAGASATVFGARGAASFLSRSTAVLATVFFLLSLGMGWFIAHRATRADDPGLGVMSGVVESPAAATETPQASPAPAAGEGEVPTPAAAAPAEAAGPGELPAPNADAPKPEQAEGPRE